MPMAKPILS